MGLLNFGSSLDDPRTQGLLALGLGLMGGRGNFGQVLSQAGMQGLGAYQAGQDRVSAQKRSGLQQAMLEMQMAAAKRAADQEERDRVLIGEFAGPRFAPGSTVMKPDSMKPVPFSPLEMLRMGASPQAVQTVAGLQAPKTLKLGKDETLLDPVTLKPLAQGPGSLPSAVQEYKFAQSQGYRGTFEQWDTARKQAGATNISLASPIAVQDPADPTGRRQMLVQPANKPGVAPQVLQIPGGGPARPAKEATMTGDQAKANLFASRMVQADEIMNNLEGQYNRTWLSARQTAGDGVIGTIANSRLPAEAQQVDQAQRDFINAVLRRESGAVIGPTEFQNARIQYFPQPGDSPQTIRQKANNRRTAIKGMIAEAGNAAPVNAQPQTSPATHRWNPETGRLEPL